MSPLDATSHTEATILLETLEEVDESQQDTSKLYVNYSYVDTKTGEVFDTVIIL